MYGLDDRGRLAPGLRADVIDLGGMRLGLPELLADLPTGVRRVVQRATGYNVTVCAGEVTVEHDHPTHTMASRLLGHGHSLTSS